MIIRYYDANLISFLSNQYDQDIEILEGQARNLIFRIRNHHTYAEIGWESGGNSIIVRTECGQAAYQIEVNPCTGSFSNDIEVPSNQAESQDACDAYVMICGILLSMARHFGCNRASSWVEAIEEAQRIRHMIEA
jgi:hypothetical protein